MRLSQRPLESRVKDAAPPSPTDEVLVARYKAGDESAFDSLVDRHAQSVARLVMKLMLHAQDVPDIVQDVFVDVLGGLKRFRGEATFRTWLVTVTIRRCRRHRRREWTRRLWRGGESERTELLPGSDAPPDSSVIGEERANGVRTAVGKLPESLREVVVLRYFEQMEIADLAVALGVSRSAVDMRLTRAKALLRDRLRNWSGKFSDE